MAGSVPPWPPLGRCSRQIRPSRHQRPPNAKPALPPPARPYIVPFHSRPRTHPVAQRPTEANSNLVCSSEWNGRPGRRRIVGYGACEAMLKNYAVVYAAMTEMALRTSHALADWAIENPNKHIHPADKAHHDGMETLKRAEQVCAMLPLGTLAREINRLQRDHTPMTDPTIFARDLDKIYLRFRDELTDLVFLYVSKEDAQFYSQQKLFGDAVWKKFKSARSDIQSAGDCFALQQSTACVFHLMRAMETIIRQIGGRIGVTGTDSGKKTWRKITDEMDHRIGVLPESTAAQRRRKEALKIARVHLHHVGEVWRNKAMHPSGSYTHRQARDVLDATRVSMQSLVAL
jgi:hypothetical protein